MISSFHQDDNSMKRPFDGSPNALQSHLQALSLLNQGHWHVFRLHANAPKMLLLTPSLHKETPLPQAEPPSA